MGFLSGSDGKESTCNPEDLGLITGLGRSPGGGLGNPLQCSCLENPHGWRSLVDYSPWSHKESDTTERLSTAQHMQKNPYSEKVIVKKLQICNQECTKIQYLESFFFFWPYCMACGILVPCLGIEPLSPALEVWSLNHWTARKFPAFILLTNIYQAPMCQAVGIQRQIRHGNHPQKTDRLVFIFLPFSRPNIFKSVIHTDTRVMYLNTQILVKTLHQFPVTERIKTKLPHQPYITFVIFFLFISQIASLITVPHLSIITNCLYSSCTPKTVFIPCVSLIMPMSVQNSFPSEVLINSY